MKRYPFAVKRPFHNRYLVVTPSMHARASPVRTMHPGRKPALAVSHRQPAPMEEQNDRCFLYARSCVTGRNVCWGIDINVEVEAGDVFVCEGDHGGCEEETAKATITSRYTLI